MSGDEVERWILSVLVLSWALMMVVFREAIL
jgi:hypothetical protein